MTLTIKNFIQKMAEKARLKGLYENFGQAEIEKIKVKYKYNPYGTPKERRIASDIDSLNNWAINFTLQQGNL